MTTTTNRRPGTRELASGITVRSFTAPPPDFDPVRAGDTRLLAHGFPARPEEPELLRQWTRAVRRVRTVLAPAVRELPKRTPPAPVLSVTDPNTTPDLSGVVLQQPSGGISFVGGVAAVPNPYAYRQTNVWCYSASWIGIDGWLDPNPLQLGVEHDVIQYATGETARDIFPWFSWGGSGTIQLDFPLAPGDLMNWLICVDKNTFATATLYLLNESSGASTSLQVSSPDGTRLRGSSAQWMVTPGYDPSGSGLPNTLANFGDVFFESAQSSAGNAGSGDPVSMVDTNGNVLSSGMAVTDTLVRCSFIS